MSAIWLNIGDSDPERGTLLVRRNSLKFSSAGEVSAHCVEVTPETHVGGSDHVFLIREGSITLSGWDAGSALATIDARIEDRHLVMPDHDGGEMRLPIDGEAAQLEMIRAAHAWGGLHEDDLFFSRVVSTDLPRPDDPDIAGFGKVQAWYVDAPSFWAILRAELPHFDHAPEDDPAEAAPLDLTGPLRGLHRGLRTRADLMEVAGFRDLDVDSDGNPCVWQNQYRHVDPDSDRVIATWNDAWSCQCDDECPETGIAITPEESTWIGPEHPVLKELWDRMPEAGLAPEPAETPSP